MARYQLIGPVRPLCWKRSTYTSRSDSRIQSGWPPVGGCRMSSRPVTGFSARNFSCMPGPDRAWYMRRRKSRTSASSSCSGTSGCWKYS